MTPSLADGDGGAFDAIRGAVLPEITADLVLGEVRVRPELCGADGELDAGVICALAQSAALAGARVVAGGSVRALQSIVSHLEPVREGSVQARAVRRHAGRTTSIWEVELTSDRGRRVAVARVTVAVVA